MANSMIVKPKVRTPVSTTMYLSSLDQHLIYFVQCLFFFKGVGGLGDLSRKLQEALSELLVPYYFFAGRLKINEHSRLEINCNDAGALFATSTLDINICNVQSSCDMDAFFHQPPPDVPLEELPLLTIQLTKMADGYAIGAMNHHILADATSGIQFYMNYASFARGEGLVIVPNSDRSRLKAIRILEHPEFEERGGLHRTLAYDLSSGIRESVCRSEKIRKSLLVSSLPERKVYPFTSEMLFSIKSKATSYIKCSTFEALAAHVWKAHANVIENTDWTRLQFAVDVRNILNPPLGNDFCGNAYFPAYTEKVLRKVLVEEDLAATVRRVQQAKEQLTDEYVRSAWEFLEKHPHYWYQHDCDTVINSWPRVMHRALDLDFGNGKAARVEFPRDPRNTKIFFFPLRRDGVDVSVCIHASRLSVFEKLLLH